MDQERGHESTEEPTEILEPERPASAPDAELIARGVVAEEIDWDLVEKEKADGHRIIFTAKSAATGKTYEYTAEEVKAMQHWTEVGNKARSDLECLKARGVQNLKDGNCPRCEAKLQRPDPSCLCGARFCEYCFVLEEEGRRTCPCSKIQNRYYEIMEEASEEGMKYRDEEYRDWFNGIKEDYARRAEAEATNLAE